MQTLCAESGPDAFRTRPQPTSHDDAAYEAARCLQCGCRKPDACRLRDLCTETGARQSAFAGEHSTMARGRAGAFRFDAARCVLCGICVRTAQQRQASIAPTFQGRGFTMRIAPPLGRTWDEIPPDILAACAAACPTGAMALAFRETGENRRATPTAGRPEPPGEPRKVGAEAGTGIRRVAWNAARTTALVLLALRKTEVLQNSRYGRPPMKHGHLCVSAPLR